MIHRPTAPLALAAVATCVAGTAHAGMPMVMITELGGQRLDALSFFLAVLLACALGLQQLWNRLTAWPRLSYPRALGLAVLWGLLFHLVLTMISGARELMTPGAWEKRGATYALAGSAEAAPAALPDEAARREDLATLHRALRAYYEERGELPLSDFDADVPTDAWVSLDPRGARYIYLPGRFLWDSGGRQLLAYEPASFGDPRLALYTDGSIELESRMQIEVALQ